MKRKQLIVLHLLMIISLLLIFYFGPYYTNFLLENFVDRENPYVQSYNINFDSEQEYLLLEPTFLDQDSLIRVNFTSTQPVQVTITQDLALYMVDSPTPFYEKSLYDDSGTLGYVTINPGNFTVLAKGFGGTANFTVAYYKSIISRERTYALQGQIMYYGGIVMLVGSIAFIVINSLKKSAQYPKQPEKVREKEKFKRY